VTSRQSPWRSAILCSRVVGRKCGKNNGLALDAGLSTAGCSRKGNDDAGSSPPKRLI
jgi:hypothetical protein